MKKIFDGVYFTCAEIKSELLKEVGITPERLAKFIFSASLFDYEDFEPCNYNSLKGWEDADGITTFMEDILPLMNYNKWSEEDQESEKFYSVMDELKDEVTRCILFDEDEKDVMIDYFNDRYQGNQFFILAKNHVVNIDTVDEDDEDEDEDDPDGVNDYYVYRFESGEEVDADRIEDYDDAIDWANDFVKDYQSIGAFVDNGDYVWGMNKGERIAIVRDYWGKDLYFTDVCKKAEKKAKKMRA